ncbi:Protein CBG20336 [Caenorhabditis briggsae]|uniref:Protein CBG20336 n=1 Tax=Caenorhabditis briggsae TaxID=6238 RepID=A8XXK5_CAEBR|nr:Protein CBG20336 [Caenorhabditis briggsae]CAP37374.2 Protein CBG20336 [Caenorhabditis briggsae]
MTISQYPYQDVSLIVIHVPSPSSFLEIIDQNRRHMICGAIVTVLVTWHVCLTTGNEDFIPVQNITEGSGQEEMTIWSNDLPPLSSEIDFLRSTTQKTVTKRATKTFYNGILDRPFFSVFSYSKPIIPPTAIIPLNRPLQRGNSIPQLQYIALWAPRGQPPHWGAIFQNVLGKLDGSFIKDRRIYNLSSTEMQNTPVRLVQYVGNEQENNFKFAWTKAIDVDMATVVSEHDYTQKCSPRMAPAVLQDQGYEFLGEADIDNRIMYYVDHNIVNSVSG